MRQRPQFSMAASPMSRTADSVALFEDYAVRDKERGYFMGSVCRIKNGSKDYRKPVNYDHADKDKIQVDLVVYKEVGQKDSCAALTLTTDRKSAKLCDILTHVNLSMQNDGTLTISHEDISSVVKLIQPRQARKRQQTNMAQYESDDGMVRVEVVPQQNDGAGIRRSTRKRMQWLSTTSQ